MLCFESARKTSVAKWNHTSVSRTRRSGLGVRAKVDFGLIG